MQCVTPMFRRYVRGDHKKGTVIAREQVMDELIRDPNRIRESLEDYNKSSDKWQYELIPCRKCWACQLNYSAEWATRIMLECKEHQNNWFLTLTYDDEHLPILEEITGENILIRYEDGTKKTEDMTFYNDGTWTGSLYPDHMKTFINTMRKEFERKGFTGIKYFYAGEYGETTQRPHYHIILMNCPLDPNMFYDCHVDSNFKAHWKSKQVKNWWNKGMIDIADVEWSSAAYVARYCTKKLTYSRNKIEYFEQGKYPEFIRMSNGIAFNWYKEHKYDLYKNDEIIMRTIKGNIGSARPPKAFDRKLQEEDPKLWKKISESRKKAAERSRKLQQEISDYTDLKQLELKASEVYNKIKLLPRELPVQ